MSTTEEKYKHIDEFYQHILNPELDVKSTKVEGLIMIDGKEQDAIEYKFIVHSK